MKKVLVVLFGVGLVCALLVARLLFKQQGNFIGERTWFAKALRYEFSARVDSVWLYDNGHGGRLRCLLTEGDPQIHREDSLKRMFQDHDMLYLIYERSADSITFILPENANRIAIGDSMRVSSKENAIRFFRDRKLVASDSLSNVLTGFGRPFFMKPKNLLKPNAR